MKRQKHTQTTLLSVLPSRYEGNTVTITPQNPVILARSAEFSDALTKLEIPVECIKATIDLSQVEQYDSYLVVLISHIRSKTKSTASTFELQGMIPQMEKYVHLLETPLLKTKSRPELPSFLSSYIANVGSIFLSLIADFRFFLEFLGEVFSNIFRLIWSPRSIRWKDFPFYFLRAGVNALPIVVLVGFLIGLIIGYQGAMQLHQFGADIFLADLVGISITRELAPLMTANLLASGKPKARSTTSSPHTNFEPKKEELNGIY
ncbi:MAG: ABC transporter permease, partial [Ignavibacteriae bacterium]|nr:ABC transporter permease [Ignavibacteriota bacterium]